MGYKRIGWVTDGHVELFSRRWIRAIGLFPVVKPITRAVNWSRFKPFLRFPRIKQRG